MGSGAVNSRAFQPGLTRVPRGIATTIAMEDRPGLMQLPAILIESAVWTVTVAGIAVWFVFVGLRARRTKPGGELSET